LQAFKLNKQTFSAQTGVYQGVGDLVYCVAAIYI